MTKELYNCTVNNELLVKETLTANNVFLTTVELNRGTCDETGGKQVWDRKILFI